MKLQDYFEFYLLGGTPLIVKFERWRQDFQANPHVLKIEHFLLAITYSRRTPARLA
jgi:hypothetical protein